MLFFQIYYAQTLISQILDIDISRGELHARKKRHVTSHDVIIDPILQKSISDVHYPQYRSFPQLYSIWVLVKLVRGGINKSTIFWGRH